MALVFRDGDYIPDGKGGFLTAKGGAELLERVLWKLTVRRGSFPFLPQLGSRLHLLCRATAREREALAEQYVKEALADEEVNVTAVRLSPDGEGRATLAVDLLYQGENLTAAIQVGGLT